MKFLKTEDVQQILQINDRQARALMRTEGFPSIKIGREYRVEEEAFTNWIRSTKEIRLDYSKC